MLTKTVSRDDLMWLVGIFEGEGCFSKSGKPNEIGGSPVIKVAMTDLDVMQRVHRLTGCTSKLRTVVPKSKIPGKVYKLQYGAEIKGQRAIAWMFMVYPFMGQRRQGRIREVVKLWKQQKANPAGENRDTVCSHKGKRRVSQGLCPRCSSALYKGSIRYRQRASC